MFSFFSSIQENNETRNLILDVQSSSFFLFGGVGVGEQREEGSEMKLRLVLVTRLLREYHTPNPTRWQRDPVLRAPLRSSLHPCVVCAGQAINCDRAFSPAAASLGRR